MDGADSDTFRSRSSKRRRINGTHSPSRYSSPDELAASSDHETPTTYHRRTSSSNLNIRRTPTDHRRRSYEDTDPGSPDELDHTFSAFYRDKWSRNLRPPITSRHATPDAPSEISMLTPVQEPASPATPPPPPIKEARFLPYRQKMVLKGHKRAVAAVRFSPKGDMVASC
ncbi:MAG: hypothetical protein Q9181_006740, partial [Wetmoreana brouardii]